MILDTEYYNDYWSDWAVQKEDPQRALHLLSSLDNVTVLIDEGMQIEGITFWGSPWGESETFLFVFVFLVAVLLLCCSLLLFRFEISCLVVCLLSCFWHVCVNIFCLTLHIYHYTTCILQNITTIYLSFFLF
jgi:hypothetical protein